MPTLVERLFTTHPASVGETYIQHLVFAGTTGVTLVLAGLAAVAHGVLPCAFTRTSSTTVLRLAADMRSRVPPAAREGGTPAPHAASSRHC